MLCVDGYVLLVYGCCYSPGSVSAHSINEGCPLVYKTNKNDNKLCNCGVMETLPNNTVGCSEGLGPFSV